VAGVERAEVMLVEEQSTLLEVELQAEKAKLHDVRPSSACCTCNMSHEDEFALRKPANSLFIESELAVYDPIEEYDELATQVTMNATASDCDHSFVV
jgi:hypothetical protein